MSVLCRLGFHSWQRDERVVFHEYGERNVAHRVLHLRRCRRPGCLEGGWRTVGITRLRNQPQRKEGVPWEPRS